jgi:4-hydroxy-2-oxoglutarate aldolase
MNKRYTGIFAPLTTPFKEESVSIDEFKNNIQKYNETDLSGYVILGTSGESAFLTDRESELLIREAKECASPGKKIIAGTGKESTTLTVQFTNDLADSGADAALVRTPSYFRAKMDYSSLKKHFITVADRSKIPIILYNNPRVMGVSMEPRLIIELSQHPNIAGIKDSSGNMSQLGEIIPRIDTDFDCLLGAAGMLLSGLQTGAQGGILALADIVPHLCTKLYNLFLEKKLDEARELQFDLIPLNKAIIQMFGIPSIKYSLDLLGYYGGPCRLPLLELNEDEKKQIKDLLLDLGQLDRS